MVDTLPSLLLNPLNLYIMINILPIVQFELPQTLACPLPTEERGIARDDVRLLVSQKDGASIEHTHFHQLDHFLQAGDVLVVNTSATIPAAIPITLYDGKRAMLHLGNQLNNKHWLAEIRLLSNNKTHRWKGGQAGLQIKLPASGSIELMQRFHQAGHLLDLWEIKLNLPSSLMAYLHQHAQPIKYSNTHKPYPVSYYQTHFAQQAGSAEMPSAARGFTARLVEKLEKKGVIIAPILLHTGVSSLEINEKPYPEYMEISTASAQLINKAKVHGQRIIAVGTTAIRALESAVDKNGALQAYKGYTELYIEHDHQLQIVDGLLSGFHEPEASHLHMLQALISAQHLQKAYQAAIQEQYYWHEFGDLHLMF